MLRSQEAKYEVNQDYIKLLCKRKFFYFFKKIHIN